MVSADDRGERARERSINPARLQGAPHNDLADPTVDQVLRSHLADGVTVGDVEAPDRPHLPCQGCHLAGERLRELARVMDSAQEEEEAPAGCLRILGTGVAKGLRQDRALVLIEPLVPQMPHHCGSVHGVADQRQPHGGRVPLPLVRLRPAHPQGGGKITQLHRVAHPSFQADHLDQAPSPVSAVMTFVIAVAVEQIWSGGHRMRDSMSPA